RVSPNYPTRLFNMPCPLPRWTGTGAFVGCFPVPRGPSPNIRRVGVHDFTFGACSGFTRVTACWIAQPPMATFVTRLQPVRLPVRVARQLPGPTDNFLGGSQGNRISNLSQHTGEEAVAPGGPPELFRQRALGAFATHQVECHVAQDGEVLRAVVQAVSCPVFVHGDVQAPV